MSSLKKKIRDIFQEQVVMTFEFFALIEYILF